MLVAGGSVDMSAAARVGSTRWLVFGNAAYDLNVFIGRHSWLELNKTIPGGMSSDMWKKLKEDDNLHYVDPVPVDGLWYLNFGRGSNRIVLVANSPTVVDDFRPHRLGNSTWIMANPATLALFTAWFAAGPGDTNQLVNHFSDIPGGVSGRTLTTIRAAVAVQAG